MMRRLTAAFFAVALSALSFSAPAQAQAWQCVPFARLVSGISLFGDAWTWWRQAADKYTRGSIPEVGSVLVFKPYGAMSKGHLAVVSQVLTDRIIQVTHANWSPIGGQRGQVEKDVTVADVSPAGDWSQVKVWYDPVGDLGTTVYPTYGFIHQAAETYQAAQTEALAAAAETAQVATAAITGMFDRTGR